MISQWMACCSLPNTDDIRRTRGDRHSIPRYEFFRRIVDVFERAGRSVPVFNDKHLSWKWEWAKEMVDTSRKMGFALMAGSSLPVTTRLPPVELPDGAEVEEALCVGVGGPDGYDIHCLEAVQGMVERRKGGETGVVAIQAIRGEAFWRAMRAGVLGARRLGPGTLPSVPLPQLAVDTRTRRLQPPFTDDGRIAEPSRGPDRLSL